MMHLDLLPAIAKRLREERGMTLTELLSATLVGGLVVSAAIMLVVISMRSSVRVSDRVNAAAVGRSGMELITQRVRSQSCLYPGEASVNDNVRNSDGQNSVLFAGPTEIAFIGDLSNAGGASNVAGSVGFIPRVHYVTVKPRGNARGDRIVYATKQSTTTEPPFNWVVGNGGPTSFTSIATPSAIEADTTSAEAAGVVSLADGVSQATSSANVVVPYFQYYDKDNLGPTGTPLAMSAGALPLTALASIAKVNVSFMVLGASGVDRSPSSGTGPTQLDKRTATFQADIPFRTDPDACG